MWWNVCKSAAKNRVKILWHVKNLLQEKQKELNLKIALFWSENGNFLDRYWIIIIIIIK